MTKQLNRADFMTTAQRSKMERAGKPPRDLHVCKKLTGVGRPGKTAKDLALRNR